MNVIDRIEQAPACQVINLSESEKGIYNGSGWKLARFVDGQLTELFDPMETEYNADVQTMIDAAMHLACGWLSSAKGEVWLVMCSCYQLCEPRQITLTEAAAIAHIGRVFAEQFMEEF